MKEHHIGIEGISALLQHKYLFADEAEVFSRKRSGVKDYSLEWEKSCYWHPEVGLYQPGVHIEAALIKSATNFQIPGRQKKTYKDLFKGTVFAKPELIPYGFGKLSPDGLLKKGLIEVHRAVCVVQKSRIERLRPLVPAGWKLKFTLQLFDDQLPRETLKEILDYAGRFIGIGDWRPRFGRFIVTEFK